MSILKELQKLEEAEIISQETANSIRNYYQTREGQSQSRLFVIFAIFGSILIGLGIVLIIAHNWDELSRQTKTFIAFLPLLIGQGFCGFALLKKQESVAWIESSAAFLFFAVGTSISLVSQTYQIPGNLSSFLLTWMLLCFPLIYIMKSAVVSMLYIVGITVYACETCYFSFPTSESYIYWLLLLIAIPYYLLLHKNRPKSNFTTFHNWIVPVSVTIVLGSVANENSNLIYVAYVSLFGLFYLIGNSDFFKNYGLKSNGYLIIGSLGTVILLLILSFDFIWKEMLTRNYHLDKALISPEFFASLILSVLAGGLFYFRRKNKPLADFLPIEPVFVLFIIIFLFSLTSSTIPTILINLLVFGIGILTIRIGAKRDHLGILNYGLLIVTALVVCRFFDEKISFVIRGILFVSVGIGFFATNYWILKKRKTHEL